MSSSWRMGREAGADLSQVLAVPKFQTAKFSETHRQKIYYSLEFLVDNPIPYCDLANINNPGTSKKVNNSLIKALLICQDKNSTWQRDMENRLIVLDNHESRSDTCFLEILDGCHSVTATETIAAKLPLLFLDQLPQIGTSYKNNNDKEQILDFFCHGNQGRLQGKREEPGKEETNKTSPYESVCQVLLENADFYDWEGIRFPKFTGVVGQW